MAIAAALLRIDAAPNGFQQLGRDEAHYTTLLAAYKKRKNGFFEGSWKEGWTKAGRCEMVAKEAFEQMKNINSLPPADIDRVRRQISKVIEDEVVSRLGETNRLVHQVDTRIDNTGIFNKIDQHATTLHLRKGLQDLGAQTANVQWINRNGAPHGVPQAGYANILNMSNSEVDEHLAKLADFEKEIEKVDPKILKAMTFDKDEFYRNVNIAKAQLKMRKDRLKVLASELPTRLLGFRRDAKALDPADRAANGIGQQALTNRANAIKADLDSVEELYKNVNSEDRNWIKGQLDQLNAHGKCPRSKKALAVNLQEPILTLSEVGYSLAITTIAGTSLNFFAGGTSIFASAATFVSGALSGTSLAIGAIALAAMSYQRGGPVAEWLE